MVKDLKVTRKCERKRGGEPIAFIDHLIDVSFPPSKYAALFIRHVSLAAWEASQRLHPSLQVIRPPLKNSADHVRVGRPLV